jgi:hypothetical protein
VIEAHDWGAQAQGLTQSDRALVVERRMEQDAATSDLPQHLVARKAAHELDPVVQRPSLGRSPDAWQVGTVVEDA